MTLTTYAELFKLVRRFGEGGIPFLIIHGGPGVGKTRIIKQAVGDQAHWLSGHVSANGFYGELHANVGRQIVVDDDDDLYRDSDKVRILKQLCQSEPRKKVSWLNANTRRANNDLPAEFETDSKVCLILNDWQNRSRHVGAVADRAIKVLFLPSAREVHGYVGSWREGVVDDEVYAYITRHLPPTGLNCRHYLKATQIKDVLDWKQYLAAQWNGELSAEDEVLRIIQDSKLKTKKDQVAAYFERTGRSRADFYRFQAALRSSGQIPNKPWKRERQPGPERIVTIEPGGAAIKANFDLPEKRFKPPAAKDKPWNQAETLPHSEQIAPQAFAKWDESEQDQVMSHHIGEETALRA